MKIKVCKNKNRTIQILPILYRLWAFDKNRFIGKHAKLDVFELVNNAQLRKDISTNQHLEEMYGKC